MFDKKYIVFMLPGRDRYPIGGYKVVYEYASLFCNDGWNVTIIYPDKITGCINDDFNVISKIKDKLALRRRFSFYKKKFGKKLKAGEWFPMSSKIKKKFVFRLSSFILFGMPKNTKYVATAIETSYALAAIRWISNKNKYYFIQDYEKWKGATDDYVLNSYRYPMKKIAIAPWLVERVKSVGQTAVLIPNGFDFTYFQLINPIENRSSTEVAMLYHLDDRKRCCDSMAALEIVKQQIPELHVAMFGTPERPDNLPEWYSYYQTPDRKTHNMIYNNAAIFVAASKAEGMALPPAESMICGCALVCTDIPGFASYAKNNETALVSPVFDVRKLAENIIKLIQYVDLRIYIAKSGNKFIQQFSWDNAFSLFKKTLAG